MESIDSFGNFANRSSSKWRRFAPDVMPMHVAEMDFEIAEVIREQLIDFTNRSDLGYLGPIPELAEAFEGFAKKRWGWEIEKESLRVATDVGVAAVEVLRALTSPGDRVLLNTPVYSAFFNWLREVGAVPFDAPLIHENNQYRLDLAAIERAFEDGVKVYLLCSPQNPVGLVHSAKDLTEIARLADLHGVIVIADEIHAPLTWVPFTPYLSLGDAAERTGVMISSSSKGWNTAGLKGGFVLTQGPEVKKALAKLPESMHYRAGILGVFSMATAYSSATDWLDETVTQIQHNYLFLEAELARQLPKATLTPMESTYLAWIDLSAYRVNEPQKLILEVAKVSLVAGSDHGIGDEYAGFVRFNVATSQARIAEALSRMAKVLEG